MFVFCSGKRLLAFDRLRLAIVGDYAIVAIVGDRLAIEAILAIMETSGCDGALLNSGRHESLLI